MVNDILHALNPHIYSLENIFVLPVIILVRLALAQRVISALHAVLMETVSRLYSIRLVTQVNVNVQLEVMSHTGSV